MADEEHLARLKQGVEAWNQWRAAHPDIQPNLDDADLLQANLCGVNLQGTGLRRADLREAELADATLIRADLQGANLLRAAFERAHFHGTNLQGATLSEAVIGWTTFGDVDLSQVRGLDRVRHVGPSTLGIDTLYRSQGQIPEVFLRGAGVPEDFITYIKSLVGRPFEFYSCFISYSNKDQEFAERLYADLQSKRVRCWFAPEDLKIGEKFRTSIDEAIRIRDKLLLVLSTHSMTSEWVETEVETAVEEEHRRKKTILFPIRLDDAVLETHQAWAANIRRTRHIGDFQMWKDYDAYQQGFQRLLRDLKAAI